MKKLFSLVLVLILVLSAICVVPASAEDATKLTVSTANLTGTKAKKYAVGDEFVYFVGLNTGTKKQIGNGEGYIEYDSEYLELVDYAGDYEDSEEYAFAPAIRGLNTLISNTNGDGIIKYNFTYVDKKGNGCGAYTNANSLFVRYVFRVKKVGETTISSTIKYMDDVNEVHIFYKGAASTDLNPYYYENLLPKSFKLGDANSDGKISVADATIIYRIYKKAKSSDIYDLDACDINRDGKVNLTDATLITRAVKIKKNNPVLPTLVYVERTK